MHSAVPLETKFHGLHICWIRHRGKDPGRYATAFKNLAQSQGDFWLHEKIEGSKDNESTGKGRRRPERLLGAAVIGFAFSK